VDLWAAYAHITPQTHRLLQMGEAWAKESNEGRGDGRDFLVVQPRYQPKQAESLEARLGEEGVKALAAAFLAGTSKQELADQHLCNVSTIKRVLRQRGIRRWTKS